jgi:hypothetical protein
MYLLFHLGHPDVLPLGDLGVRKGMAVHFGLMSGKQALGKGNNKQLPSPDDMIRLTEHWKVSVFIIHWLEYIFSFKTHLTSTWTISHIDRLVPGTCGKSWMLSARKNNFWAQLERIGALISINQSRFLFLEISCRLCSCITPPTTSRLDH